MIKKPLVVLVGHTSGKLDNLKRLYNENMPEEPHDLFVVYNGDGKYLEANVSIGNTKSRDIGMYYEAVKTSNRNFIFYE